MRSTCGHDAFLLPNDLAVYGQMMRAFLDQLSPAPKAQAAVAQIGTIFNSILEEHLRLYSPERWLPGGMNMAALKQSRTEAMTRALKMAADAGR